MTVFFKANRDLSNVLSNVSRISERIADATEHLAAGLRIERTQDDPGSIAHLADLQSDAAIFGAGEQNTADTAQAYSKEDDAATALYSIVSKISDLADIAQNYVTSSTQRDALNTEAQGLVTEYNRIVDSTAYNQRQLLDGSAIPLTVQVDTHSFQLSADNYSQDFTALVGETTYTASTTTSTVIDFDNSDGFNVESLQGGTYSVGPAGADPRGAASADLNGDGYDDLVSADDSTAKISVLISNGNGSFKTAVTYATGGSRPYNVRTADFNGDGSIDIVANDHFGMGVSVFLNNGNGTFKAATLYSAPNTVFSLGVGDVNGDGSSDIVASGYNGGFIEVWTNNGNGTFKAGVSYTSVTGGYYVDLVDVDGDSALDVVESSNSTMQVFINNGNGTFKAKVSYGSTVGLHSVGDFNNDGAIDIAYELAASTTVQILLNNGNGTFSVGATFTGSAAWQQISGDYNGDGNTDIVQAATSSSGIAIFFGNGDGTFRTGPRIVTGAASGFQPAAITQGDFNNDGAPDLGFVDYSTERFAITLGLVGSHTAVTTLYTPTTTYLNATIDLTTQRSAAQSYQIAEDALQYVTNSDGGLHGAEHRVESAQALVSSAKQISLDAAQRITDVDTARVTALRLHDAIIADAGQALVAQASLSAERVLNLLHGTASSAAGITPEPVQARLRNTSGKIFNF